jgi:FkbM family methyltransferase
MQPILTHEITRRNPFRIKKVPWIAQIYAHPFDRWSSLGTQALFGAPNFLLFLLFQKLSPFRPKGIFSYQIDGREKDIYFNALNTQFSALYLKNFSGGYEPHISALLDLLLPTNGVFYDIGSNWGWFSLLLASKPGFNGKIHAFEPFPPSYQDICSVAQQAGLENKIQVHNLALSDRSGKTSMRLPDRFQSGRATMSGNEDNNEGESLVDTMDSLNIEPPHIIKADVEGLEAKVFRGGAKFLAQHKPMLVFEHTRRNNDPWSSLEPLEFLHSLGYELFHVGWLRQSHGKTFLIGDDLDNNPQKKETLALATFDWNERFLRYEGMNIFACHRDKISQLKSVFANSSPTS